jgi:hypothetical protein
MVIVLLVSIRLYQKVLFITSCIYCSNNTSLATYFNRGGGEKYHHLFRGGGFGNE